MQTAVKMGHNVTGAQMSPKDSEAQLKATRDVPPDVAGGPEKLALVRTREAAQAESIGSVPVPGSAKGMLKTAVNRLVGVSPEVLIDKLGERLAFERGGVRLYDALLAKAKAIDTLDKSMLQTLQHFRSEEAEHLGLVTAAIEKLGADPTAMTPCADVAGCINMGVMETITDPRTSLAQCLNALLTAELSDNAGWELLIDLANASGQSDIADSFGKALQQEQVHMRTVKDWLSQKVLGQV